MPMTLDDSAIRSALHSSISTAWSTTTVYDDPPQTPVAASKLPLGYLMLQDMEPQRSSRGAGAKEVTLVHPYTITGQFAWPGIGTIEADKRIKVQALLDQLTATTRYAGWQREVTA